MHTVIFAVNNTIVINDNVIGPLTESRCLEVFNYQHERNAVYRSFVDLIARKVSDIQSIPFLPVRFFKTHEVRSFDGDPQIVFFTSGTSASVRGRHFIKDRSIYDQSLSECFRLFYGSPRQYSIMALLPSYLEQENSSLVYMAAKLIEQSGDDRSGFYLNNTDELLRQIQRNEQDEKKTLLLGVSFALLNLAEKYPLQLHHTLVMETGGMKARREEITRDELHAVLCKRWGLKEVHSEYSMTELLSQAYSASGGRFFCPPWMKILIRDLHDPFYYLPAGRMGGVNIIDLANIHSCSFIETEDVGRINHDGSFEIFGRMDNSEARGCNLLIT